MDEKIGNKKHEAYSLVGIGIDNINLEKYMQAKQEFDSALSISKQIGEKDAIDYAYTWLSKWDSITGNYKQSLEDYEKHIIYRDSLINEATIQKTVQAEMNFNFEQKQAAQKAEQDKKDALSYAESKRQKIIILLIASVAVTLALLLFNIFSSLKTTRKQKLLVEKQKVLVELQALRAQMNPHFIFNAINSIKQFIFENDTESADRHLSRFASLIRKVLENSKQESISLSEEIQMLTLYIELEMLRFANKFSYKIEVAGNVDTEKVLISPLIIQPYVENAIWHGLMHQEKHGELLIKFEKVESPIVSPQAGRSYDTLKCTIDDNGVGRKRSAAIKKERNHKSMGLSITKERLEILNMINKTKMNLEFIDKTNEDGSSAGTRVELFVPYIVTEISHA
jgi:LytS/YehU family sensor histidine kinase